MPTEDSHQRVAPRVLSYLPVGMKIDRKHRAIIREAKDLGYELHTFATWWDFNNVVDWLTWNHPIHYARDEK